MNGKVLLKALVLYGIRELAQQHHDLGPGVLLSAGHYTVHWSAALLRDILKELQCISYKNILGIMSGRPHHFTSPEMCIGVLGWI